jgi:hypothetical protein
MFSYFPLFQCKSLIHTCTTGENYEEKTLFTTYWHGRFINLVSFYRKPSSGMWCRVVWQNFTDISSKYTVRIFGLKCSATVKLKHWNSGFLQLAGKFIPDHTATHTRKRRSSQSLPRELLISWLSFRFLRSMAHLVWSAVSDEPSILHGVVTDVRTLNLRLVIFWVFCTV